MATATTPSRRRTAVADPAKTPHRTATRSRPTAGENHDPNLPITSPPSKKAPPSTSKPKKVLHRSPVPPPPPPQRRFIVVKRNSKKPTDGTVEDRRRIAYDSLRASQDGFFAKEEAISPPQSPSEEEASTGEELLKGDVSPEVEGSVKVRKMKSRVMEEAMNSLPEQGCGRVLHLVKAFESILSISTGSVGDREGRGHVVNWALPGMRAPPPAAVSCSLSGDLFGSHGEPRLCSSLDGSISSFKSSFDSMTNGGGRRSRRNSSDSVGSRHKVLGVTHQRPFKLRTEQRGRLKEELFMRKVTEMLMEEEKLRIPQAKGLPWTTDEQECLVKPFVKEPTEPVDIVLHSDIRAVERAEFDNYVAERLSFAEQRRLEHERQQQMEEQEDIRRMRKELVPKAQPMPYFDRPFVPKKSERPQTIPREPRFHRVRSSKNHGNRV